MIKLIASDMDGTLLNTEHVISERFWKEFERLQKKGVHFVCASGRPYYNLIEYFRDAHKHVYFISENGAYTVYNDEDIAVNALPEEQIAGLLNVLDTIPEIDVILCGKHAAYVKELQGKFAEEFATYYNCYEIVDSFEHIHDDIIKISVCSFGGTEECVLPHLEEFQDTFRITVSGFVWLDVTAKGTHKGKALSIIQKRLHISPEETMVIGDYLNDLSMFDVAEESFAVANAHPQIKAKAKHVTHSNDEDGVAEAISRMIN